MGSKMSLILESYILVWAEVMLRINMSGLHLLRPLIHNSVILVICALSTFPTEKEGHTSLPRTKWGLPTMWTTGRMEVLFFFSFKFSFSLTYVIDLSSHFLLQTKYIYTRYIQERKGNIQLYRERDI